MPNMDRKSVPVAQLKRARTTTPPMPIGTARKPERPRMSSMLLRSPDDHRMTHLDVGRLSLWTRVGTTLSDRLFRSAVDRVSARRVPQAPALPFARKRRRLQGGTPRMFEPGRRIRPHWPLPI